MIRCEVCSGAAEFYMQINRHGQDVCVPICSDDCEEKLVEILKAAFEIEYQNKCRALEDRARKPISELPPPTKSGRHSWQDITVRRCRSREPL